MKNIRRRLTALWMLVMMLVTTIAPNYAYAVEGESGQIPLYIDIRDDEGNPVDPPEGEGYYLVIHDNGKKVYSIIPLSGSEDGKVLGGISDKAELNGESNFAIIQYEGDPSSLTKEYVAANFDELKVDTIENFTVEFPTEKKENAYRLRAVRGNQYYVRLQFAGTSDSADISLNGGLRLAVTSDATDIEYIDLNNDYYLTEDYVT